MGLSRSPQQATDWKSVRITRDGEGGGDFPNIDSAFEYLAGVSFTPTVSDPFEIILGPGTHTKTNSSVTVLPTGTILRGSGPGATRLQGTNASNPMFECGDAIISDLSFLNCSVAIERTSGSSLTRLENVFATSIDTLYIADGGVNIIQNCNITGGSTAASFICNGGTIFALLNVFFNAVPSNGTRVDVNDGRFAMRNCVFDGSLSSNATAINVNSPSSALVIECSSNDYINMATPIVLEDNTYTYFSQGELIFGETTGVTVNGAGGTNSADIHISDMTVDSTNISLNGNELALLTVNDHETGNIRCQQDIILKDKFSMLKTSRFRRGF